MKSNALRLPCGCEIWNEGDAFVFKAHSPDCLYYRYVLEEAERQGKDVLVREA